MNTTTIWEILILLAVFSTIIWVYILCRCLVAIVKDVLARRSMNDANLVWPAAPKGQAKDRDFVWPVEDFNPRTSNLKPATSNRRTAAQAVPHE